MFTDVPVTVVTSTANFLAISEFYSSGVARENLAADVMLGAVVVRAIVAIVLYYGVLNWESLSHILQRQFLHNSSLWVLIFLLTLISPVNIRYLPWTSNEFSQVRIIY